MFRVFVKFIFLLLMPLFAWTANAQDALKPNSISEIATNLLNYNTITEYADNEDGDRYSMMDIIMMRSEKDLTKKYLVYKRKYQHHTSLNARLLPVFEEAAILRSVGTDGFKESKAYKVLVSLSRSQDWNIANRANLALAVECLVRGEINEAVLFSQQAINVIPGSADQDLVDEARYETVDLLFTIFTFEINIEKTLQYSQEMILLGIKTKRIMDTVNILHNLVDVNYETGRGNEALIISKIMNEGISGYNNYGKILTFYDMGRSLLAVNEFKTATIYFQKALQLNPSGAIVIVINSKLALSLAESGFHAESLSANDVAHKLLSESNIYTVDVEHLPDLLRSRAMVYKAQGRTEESYALLEKWANVVIQAKNAALTDTRITAANKLSHAQDLKNKNIERLEAEGILNSKILHRTYVVAAILFLFGVGLILVLVYMNINRKKLRSLNVQLNHSIEKVTKAEGIKTDFLAMMSHELRTPLNGIMSMADLIKNSSQDKRTKRSASVIQQSGQRLYFLVKNILSAADVGQGHMSSKREMDIDKFLLKLISTWNIEIKTKNLAYNVKKQKSLFGVYNLPEDSIIMIYDNLLSNAVKFTAEGKIDVLFTTKKSDEDHDVLVITVTDTGVGISDEYLTHAMSLFDQSDNSITRPHDGAGLGLHVCSKILRDIKGTIDISNKNEIGTEVTIHIPIGEKIVTKDTVITSRAA